MYTYRYTGDLPTVFVSLIKDGHTWMPSKGDTIDSTDPISHPLLEFVDEPPIQEARVVESTPDATTEQETVEPEVTEQTAVLEDSTETQGA